jgi:hypothetical protein
VRPRCRQDELAVTPMSGPKRRMSRQSRTSQSLCPVTRRQDRLVPQRSQKARRELDSMIVGHTLRISGT